MDIGTAITLIGTARNFLGGDSEGGQKKGPSLLEYYKSIKGREDYQMDDVKVARPLDAPGQAQGIQQIDYASTRQFWDNLLREYTRK
tara:strand:- start:193 stop:453 length:261 start_codon:yes stop_codon:yes gene_type:complete